MPDTTTVTITLTDQPSRSKQAGPCWAGLFPEAGDPTFASTAGRTAAFEVGQPLRLRARATLRRATRTTVDNDEIAVVVTGDPADTVDITIGSPQSVDATVIGVRPMNEE